MTDPITFTFTQLLAFGTFLLALIGVIAKIGWSVYRMKRNDLGEFIKRDEFESLGKEVGEIGKTVERLDERSTKQEKEIDSLKSDFKWKNSK